MPKLKIRKEDQVVVIAGKDKGKSGKVVEVLPARGKVVVEGVNIAKKHQKPRSAQQPGEIIEKAMPLDISNVALADPKTGKPTRVRYEVDDKGKKTRVAKRSGQTIL